jgi:hypothetical protein
MGLAPHLIGVVGKFDAGDLAGVAGVDGSPVRLWGAPGWAATCAGVTLPDGAGPNLADLLPHLPPTTVQDQANHVVTQVLFVDQPTLEGIQDVPESAQDVDRLAREMAVDMVLNSAKN